MDRTQHYRDLICRLLEEYAAPAPAVGEIESEVIVDRKRDHYELLNHGWQGTRRVHGVVLHLDIIDGKIWIQYDGTDRPIAEELEAAGVPRDHIVLAFHPAHLRKHTGYAVG